MEFILSIFRKKTSMKKESTKQQRQQKHIFCKLYGSWYDLSLFAKSHPGGRELLEKYHLEDITKVFESRSVHEYVDIESLEKYKIKD